MPLTVLRRLGTTLASLLVASVLVFGLMVALPGDPARVALGTQATDEAVAALRHTYGLDRPLPEQYLRWAGGLVSGDLGTSYVSHTPIGPLLAERLQVSLLLVGAALVVALLIAIPLGVVTALRRRTALGVALAAVSQVGVAIPAFLVGILLVGLVAVRWRLLPANGWTPPGEDLGDFWRQLVLPAVSLGVVQAAVLARYVRSATLEVLHEDHLRTARGIGLRPAQAFWRHGLRGAAVPVMTVLGVQVATMLIGAVVVERVFVVPGLGSLLLDAVGTRDLLVVQDVVMVLVLAVLVVNLLVDLLAAVVDPRLRGGAR